MPWRRGRVDGPQIMAMPNPNRAAAKIETWREAAPLRTSACRREAFPANRIRYFGSLAARRNHAAGPARLQKALQVAQHHEVVTSACSLHGRVVPSLARRAVQSRSFE